MHRETSKTLRLALLFFGAAAVTAPLVPASERWVALHLLFTGGVALAISGASQMLAVTWAAGPAPGARVSAAQRWSVASGALLLITGRQVDLTPVIAAGAVLYVAGLALLGGLLLAITARGVERRFDPAAAAYVLAIAAALAAGGLGVAMATGHGAAGSRDAHVTLNLLGFVGLVVAGTLPYFVATAGRTRMSRRATGGRITVVVGWLALAVTAAAVALGVGHEAAARGALLAYAIGLAALTSLLPLPTRRSLRWAGPRLVALWAGTGWWIAGVTAAALAAGRGDAVLNGTWLGALAVGGFAQIIWGALAYLLPVLRGGGHERLGEGFAATRSWLGVVAVNAGAGAVLAGAGPLATVALGVWLADGAVRVAQLQGVGVRP